MKSLTKTKQIESQKSSTHKREEKKDTKSVAQCCAKVSKVVAGCHDLTSNSCFLFPTPNLLHSSPMPER